ncbi:MAG: DUF2934 domain-containing protein [Proteobacteria bacterium]|nr:MAG: DUF2934 domain-containing protein [Pseudomonadota bacterium]
MIDKITEEEVRLRSYFIWEREGRPLGRSWEHWFRAKEELNAERPSPVVNPIMQPRVEREVKPAAASPSSAAPNKKPRKRKA